jgi:hypothetical protein
MVSWFHMISLVITCNIEQLYMTQLNQVLTPSYSDMLDEFYKVDIATTQILVNHKELIQEKSTKYRYREILKCTGPAKNMTVPINANPLCISFIHVCYFPLFLYVFCWYKFQKSTAWKPRIDRNT